MCQPVLCPKLSPPSNGLITPSTCSEGPSKGRTRCSFSCQEGFIQSGSQHATCSHKAQWELPSGPPNCQANFPPPFILCPPDITKPLPQGASSVYVMFSQPKTNVDWFRYVSAEPGWAKQLEGEMVLGKHTVTFLATSPVSNQTASCKLNIHVKDTEPPRVISCPHSTTEVLARGQMLKRVTWTEPVFRDNVGIQHVMASFLPGHYFPEGRHHVLYQAADADGNRARCGFTLTIRREKNGGSRHQSNSRGRPPHPQFAPPRRAHTQNKISFNRADSVLHLPPPRLSPNKSHQQSIMPKHCEDVPSVPNGKMTCINKRRSKKCTPVCKEGYVFYQKFSARPPTYICSMHRVDWRITKFVPDCSPVEKTSQVGQCPDGWEARDSYCIACPPGMYRKSAPLCQLCPKATYTDSFGSAKCTSCPLGHSTVSLGSRSKSECKISRNGGKNRKKTREGRKGLMHYNSWLNEEPYNDDRRRTQG